MSQDISKVTYTTSINKDLKERFKIYCTLKGRYQNEVLEELIEELLAKEGVGEGDGHTNK